MFFLVSFLDAEVLDVAALFLVGDFFLEEFLEELGSPSQIYLSVGLRTRVERVVAGFGMTGWLGGLGSTPKAITCDNVLIDV